ncbi:HAD domain-containing protein [Bifidobacterium criceti]|uniref:Uncharacterized protein n=1 Tax=Bifidobacterium criceti TaxID=1960969 RepID=A0A2A2EHF2_9BIFI|nr:HAD domain-containing protein [Bifidobacterium criceti]PAU68366.1 hypothetical protein B1526_0551 [Bifidobacterium criceti]
MTDTDTVHTPRPRAVIYTDFDGVINAFPKDRAATAGDGRTFALDGMTYVPADGIAYPVHWSTQLADGMRALVDSGAAELVWLSTWQPFTPALNATLGWDGARVRTAQWYDPVTLTGMRGGKLRTVLRRIAYEDDEATPLPIVWIDDEECTVRAKQLIEAAGPLFPVFAVRPDDRIGISKRQWRLIREFVANPMAFPTVTLDVEPSVTEREGHIGL